MKRVSMFVRPHLLLRVMFISLVFASAATLADDKMTPEDVIAKHLDAVGTAKMRSAIKSRIALGTCKVTFREGKVNNGEGRAVLASDSTRNLIGMVFGYPEYPHEKIGFDGRNVTISYLKPGVRSSLGSFVRMNEVIFKDGLFGGVLSAAWPLFDLYVKQAKLEYGGLKEVDGRKVHTLKYYPKNGANVKITLFFDDESFRHVRTEYEQVIVSGQGANVDASASQLETRYKLIEEFSDFKAESNLVLPHAYKISFLFDSQRGSIRNTWTLTFDQFGFNQKFDDGAFDVNRATG